MRNNKLNKPLQQALKYLKQLLFNPCDKVEERLIGRLVTALEAYLNHQQKESSK